MLTDYSFYTTEFCGNEIPTSEQYCAAAVKAEAYVMRLTGGRESFKVKNGKELFDEAVQMAICAVAECFYKESKSAIASESLDNHSVSYAQKRYEDMRREKYEAAVTYLGNTNLLISGAMR